MQIQPRTRFVPYLGAVLALLLVGALGVLLASCRSGGEAETGPPTGATASDLSGVEVEMHHAVG